MKTKQTVVEKYNRELEEINQQIELIKAGESSGIGLINKIKGLTICAYYEGKCDGIKDTNIINKILNKWNRKRTLKNSYYSLSGCL